MGIRKSSQPLLLMHISVQLWCNVIKCTPHSQIIVKVLLYVWSFAIHSYVFIIIILFDISCRCLYYIMRHYLLDIIINVINILLADSKSILIYLFMQHLYSALFAPKYALMTLCIV